MAMLLSFNNANFKDLSVHVLPYFGTAVALGAKPILQVFEAAVRYNAQIRVL